MIILHGKYYFNMNMLSSFWKIKLNKPISCAVAQNIIFREQISYCTYMLLSYNYSNVNFLPHPLT